MSSQSQSQMLKRLDSMITGLVNEQVEEKIRACAIMYSFDAEEALSRLLDIKVSEKKLSKSSILMPFVKSAVKSDGCGGIEYNHGLFTQCCNERSGESIFCLKCDKDNTEKGRPSGGLLSERLEKGLMEFRDPSGRKPISYLNYLKKKNTSIESARNIASELGVDIEEHLVEMDSKRGRPKKEDKESSSISSSHVKGEKRGRPKKIPTKVESEKVVDLFASTIDEYLESSSNDFGSSSSVSNSEHVSDDEESSVNVSDVLESENKKKPKKESQDAEKEAKRQEKEAKKQEKEAKRQAIEAEKEAKRQALEAEKEAKQQQKEAKRQEKEAKQQQKETKKQGKEEKPTKKSEKASKNQTSENTPSSDVEKEAPKAVEKEERAKVQVSEFVYEGVKYWKSTDNIMYDPATKDVKGIWSETEQKMLPAPEESDDELSEEEYEEDDE
jgi:hypothetical protein